VRPAPDNYFVRLDPSSEAPPAGRAARPQTRFDVGGDGKKKRRRRRKRFDGRSVFFVLLLVALGAWCVWAAGRPGGISGTVNGFIEHVRGDVQDVSQGSDMKAGVKYFNQQYTQSGTYPSPSDADLSAAGVGLGLTINNCGGQAVVLHTLTASRLLMGGKDYGEVRGIYGCPADLTHPSPWKAK
jgi:hypothetical protein